ncbi:hypothetical protein [Paenibacillus pini]|uniref:Uncharacterized protein n=1 Tax=Paenibacillus pini JCM 16418 TaxID=1236976 RepID=W7Z1Q9_9BACL|nr:hypothetical protein [Paenibacillus pini]GAF10911.1 hypothetical protein JCM16418_5146 [Paenibacillus pini JCM 16418]
MFKVVGKGIFSKDLLIQKLEEWGIIDPKTTIALVMNKGKLICDNDIRILYVRGSF